MLIGALAGARELAEPLLTSSIELTLLEAQSRSGGTARPTPALDVAQRTWTSTIDLLAEFGRVVGFALAAEGSLDAGRSWFERGAHALASAGNHTALAGLADSYAEAVAARTGLSRRLARSRRARSRPSRRGPGGSPAGWMPARRSSLRRQTPRRPRWSAPPRSSTPAPTRPSSATRS